MNYSYFISCESFLLSIIDIGSRREALSFPLPKETAKEREVTAKEEEEEIGG